MRERQCEYEYERQCEYECECQCEVSVRVYLWLVAARPCEVRRCACLCMEMVVSVGL